MGNFNIKQNLIKIYKNFENKNSNNGISEYHLTTNMSTIVMPLIDIFLLPEILNANNIKSTQTKENFNSLYSLYITSK